MHHTIFTIGHSNRTFAEFTECLHHNDVDMIIDVRKLPGSRSNPQFDRDTLEEGLSRLGIAYHHMAALGGRRSRSPSVPPEVNGFWENRSFHHYADYALSGEFSDGLARLRAWAADGRIAVMCSEAVWWRCHRRIITDHLLAYGDHVIHIMAPDRTEPARPTPGAVMQPEQPVTYPHGDRKELSPHRSFSSDDQKHGALTDWVSTSPKTTVAR